MKMHSLYCENFGVSELLIFMVAALNYSNQICIYAIMAFIGIVICL